MLSWHLALFSQRLCDDDFHAAWSSIQNVSCKLSPFPYFYPRRRSRPSINPFSSHFMLSTASLQNPTFSLALQRAVHWAFNVISLREIAMRLSSILSNWIAHSLPSSESKKLTDMLVGFSNLSEYAIEFKYNSLRSLTSFSCLSARFWLLGSCSISDSRCLRSWNSSSFAASRACKSSRRLACCSSRLAWSNLRSSWSRQVNSWCAFFED